MDYVLLEGEVWDLFDVVVCFFGWFVVEKDLSLLEADNGELSCICSMSHLRNLFSL